MGWPWRDRQFDPAMWRPPVAPSEVRAVVAGSGRSDPMMGIVIGYIVSVLMSVGTLFKLLENGW